MSNILIAESGATKTAWRWCREGQLFRAWESQGLNPNTLSDHDLLSRLEAALAQSKEDLAGGTVYFYGAGLSQLPQQTDLIRVLRQVLPPTTKISVHHDLLAAVRSTGWSQGIVAILGTGSNACRFQGDQILEQRGGLGYLLGDEGSGTDLSRAWLKALLEGNLLKPVADRSLQVLGRPPAVLLREVYHAEHPAAFLASLVPLLHQLMDEFALRTMVRNRFLAFLDHSVCQFEDYRQQPLAVLGSVGFHFQDVWQEACQQRQIQVPLIQAAPIDGLVRYHLARISDGKLGISN